MVTLAGIVVGLYLSRVSKSKSEPISVLLITLDTVRADRLGCYGCTNQLTPELDKLSADGTLFENCQAPAPLTLPSHATMLTGLLPPQHGLRMNAGGALPDSLHTIATLTSAIGYHTGAFIAATVLGSHFGLDAGFDLYNDITDHERGDLGIEFRLKAHRLAPPARSGDKVTDAAISWLKEQGGAPFLCWVHLYDPHFPYDPHPTVFRRSFQHDYNAEIAFVDRQVGRIVEHLKETDRYDNTLIIVVADHGEDLGDHNEPTHGMTIYQSTMRVPLLMTLPHRIEDQHRISTTVTLSDLFPTVAGLLDIRSHLPEQLRTEFDNQSTQCTGRDLAPMLSGTQEQDAWAAYGESPAPFVGYGWAPQRSWTHGQWKYIQSSKPELFNLDADPNEQTNLVDRMPSGLKGSQTIPSLQVGIESIIRGALSAWLIGQVTLGHPHIVRAENAFPRTRERLCQHRQRSHTTLCSDGSTLNATPKTSLIEAERIRLVKRVKAGDQLAPREKTAFRTRMKPKQGVHDLGGKGFRDGIIDRLDRTQKWQ